MCARIESFPLRTTTTAATAATAAAAITTFFFQILLEVLVVARVIFKRWNPGAAEKGAGEVYLAHRHLPAQNYAKHTRAPTLALR